MIPMNKQIQKIHNDVQKIIAKKFLSLNIKESINTNLVKCLSWLYIITSRNALKSPAYAPFFCVSAIFFRYLCYQTNLLYTNLFLYFHLSFFFFYLFPPQARRAQAYS